MNINWKEELGEDTDDPIAALKRFIEKPGKMLSVIIIANIEEEDGEYIHTAYINLNTFEIIGFLEYAKAKPLSNLIENDCDICEEEKE